MMFNNKKKTWKSVFWQKKKLQRRYNAEVYILYDRYSYLFIILALF